MVAILAPLDGGAGLTVRALQVPWALCDLGSHKTNLVALNAEKSALLSQILPLEAAIFGAEFAADFARVAFAGHFCKWLSCRLESCSISSFQNQVVLELRLVRSFAGNKEATSYATAKKRPRTARSWG